MRLRGIIAISVTIISVFTAGRVGAQYQDQGVETVDLRGHYGEDSPAHCTNQPCVCLAFEPRPDASLVLGWATPDTTHGSALVRTTINNKPARCFRRVDSVTYAGASDTKMLFNVLLYSRSHAGLRTRVLIRIVYVQPTSRQIYIEPLP